MRTLPPESSSTRSTKYSTAGVWAISAPVLASRSSIGASGPPALSAPESPPTLQPDTVTLAVAAIISAASRFVTLAIVPLLFSEDRDDRTGGQSTAHRGCPETSLWPALMRPARAVRESGGGAGRRPSRRPRSARRRRSRGRLPPP